MQGELFENKVSLPTNFKGLAKWDPTAAYQIARHRGYLHGQAIWEVVKANLSFDWEKLWEDFEKVGYITHLKIKIDQQELEVIDHEMIINFNGNMIDYYSEEDVFDKKMENRIKSNIKKFILANQFQFDIDENTF